MKKDFLLYLSPSLLTGIFGILVMVPFTTYYLSAADFGIYSILTAVMMPIGPLSSTGVSWVLSANYHSTNDHDLRTLLFNMLVLEIAFKIFWVMLFWLAAPFLLPLVISDFQPQYILYFQLTLVATLLMTFWPSISSLIILQKKSKVHVYFEIMHWITGAVTTITCLVVLKMRTMTLFVSPIVTGVFSTIVSVIYFSRHINWKFQVSWLKEIAKVGFPSIPTNLVEMINNISDRFFIQKWQSLAALGIYAHSQSYRGVFTVGTKAFSRSFSPILLESFAANKELDSTRKMLRGWYGLLTIIGVGVVLFSYDGLKILTHNKFVAAAPLVLVWFLFMLSFTYGLPSTQYLFLHKKNGFMMLSGVIINIIGLLATAWAAYRYGILGVAIVTVGFNFLMQFLRDLYARVVMNMPAVGIGDFLKSLVCLAAVFAVSHLLNFHLVVSIGFFVFVSIVVALVFGLFGSLRTLYCGIKRL